MKWKESRFEINMFCILNCSLQQEHVSKIREEFLLNKETKKVVFLCFSYFITKVSCFWRVRFFGSRALTGWYISSVTKYGVDPDSEQVPWGKDEKDFEKRVKSMWNCWKGSNVTFLSFLFFFYSIFFIIWNCFIIIPNGKLKIV